MLAAVRRPIGAVLVGCLLVLGGALAGCGGSSADGKTLTDVDVEEPRLTTLESTGQRAFSGVLVNRRSRPIKVAEVRVALYGPTGQRVGMTVIEVEDVPANDRKRFSGPLRTDADVQGARVRSVMAP